MRSVNLNRVVERIPFLSGVLLYAGEGTKSIASGKVEIANSNAGILRLFVAFLGGLTIPKAVLCARVQIHHHSEMSSATEWWERELGLLPRQFIKPMVSVSGGRVTRKTFTLQLTYQNSMLLRLMRYWTANLEQTVVRLMRN